MNLSKIEVIVIAGIISLAVLLFGSWFLKYHMETRIVFSAIGLCFIGVLLIVCNGGRSCRNCFTYPWPYNKVIGCHDLQD